MVVGGSFGSPFELNATIRIGERHAGPTKPRTVDLSCMHVTVVAQGSHRPGAELGSRKRGRGSAEGCLRQVCKFVESCASEGAHRLCLAVVPFTTSYANVSQVSMSWHIRELKNLPARNSWLNDVFPKFVSKSKGKNQAELPQPPPHTLRFVSKCDVEIGPHIFYECLFYEAIYTPTSLPMTNSISAGSQSARSPGTPSRNASSSKPAPALGSAGTAQSSTTQESWKPEITPALIAQVNEAASTNPTLQSLLQSAAKGEASQDQLKTLGFFIQSLAASRNLMPSLVPQLKASQSFMSGTCP